MCVQVCTRHRRSEPRPVALCSRRTRSTGTTTFIEGKGTAARRVRLGGPYPVHYLETSPNSSSPSLRVTNAHALKRHVTWHERFECASLGYTLINEPSPHTQIPSPSSVRMTHTTRRRLRTVRLLINVSSCASSCVSFCVFLFACLFVCLFACDFSRAAFCVFLFVF